MGLFRNHKTYQRKRAPSVISSDIIPATIQPSKKSKRGRRKSEETTSVLKKETRESIIAWLNDNKNKFDKITQTQQTVSSKCSQESFDMPSVSQFRRNKKETVPIAPPYLRRTLSFPEEHENISRETRVRCNSWPCENDALYDCLANEECMLLFLEETRRTAELKQKEEEFLMHIESELQTQKMKEEPKPISRENIKNTKILTERKITTENQRCYDLEVVEAYFNKNLSKITNNGVDFHITQTEFKKPAVETELEENRSIELSSENSKDYVYRLDTQKIPSPTKPEKLFAELERCIQEIQLLSSSHYVAKNCDLLRKYAQKIQKFICDGVETDESPKLLPDICLLEDSKCCMGTQTETILLLDVATQTDQKLNLRSSSSTILSEPFDGRLINKLVEKYGKTQKKQSQPLENGNISSNFDQVNVNTQNLLNGQKNTVKEIDTSISSSLDDIDYDTQQLIQKTKKSLNSSLEKKSVSKRLDYSENKKFKRIRMPSDSDSDMEVQDKKRNKYIQEDISVQFESEAPEPNRSTEEDFKLSDDVNYNVS